MNEVELVSLYHEAIPVFFTVVTIMTSLLYAVLHRRAQRESSPRHS